MTNVYSWIVGLSDPVIPVHRVFQCIFSTWQWLRNDMESEVSLRSRKRLTTTERKLAGLARIAFAVRDAFSYVEVYFHSPTLSSALSNMGTIGSTSQEMWRKLDENAAIEKRSRSSTRTVHGKRRSLWLHCQEMMPNHLATGYKLEHTN